MEDNHDKKVAERFASFRKKYIHKSQNKAEPMLGMTQSKLWYIENAKSPISFELITTLVKDYQLNTDWLATGNGDMIDKNPPKKLDKNIIPIIIEINCGGDSLEANDNPTGEI